MAKASLTKAQNLTELPLERLGRAAPPLYDGLIAILIPVHKIQAGKEIRPVTSQVRNCAARMLAHIHDCLLLAGHPEDGVPISRNEFHHLFHRDYSLNTIYWAQILLVESGFICPFDNDPAHRYAFCWKIDYEKLQAAIMDIPLIYKDESEMSEDVQE